MAIFNDIANVNNNSPKADKSADKKSAKKGDEKPEGGCGCRDPNEFPLPNLQYDLNRQKPHEGVNEPENMSPNEANSGYKPYGSEHHHGHPPRMNHHGGFPDDIPEGNNIGANYAYDKTQIHGEKTYHRKFNQCDRYFHGVTKGKEGCGCTSDDKYQHDYNRRVAGPCDRHQIKPGACDTPHEHPCENHPTVRQQPITLKPLDPCELKKREEESKLCKN